MNGERVWERCNSWRIGEYECETIANEPNANSDRTQIFISIQNKKGKTSISKRNEGKKKQKKNDRQQSERISRFISLETVIFKSAFFFLLFCPRQGMLQ